MGDTKVTAETTADLFVSDVRCFFAEGSTPHDGCPRLFVRVATRYRRVSQQTVALVVPQGKWLTPARLRARLH